MSMSESDLRVSPWAWNRIVLLHTISELECELAIEHVGVLVWITLACSLSMATLRLGCYNC